MKKIIYFFIFILCLFTINTTFHITSSLNPAYAVEETQTLPDEVNKLNAPPPDDILDKPVFEQDKKQSVAKKITGKVSGLIIQVVGAGILLLIVVICLSFIWISNLQRRKNNKKNKAASNQNVIDAVDNFTRPRIK